MAQSSREFQVFAKPAGPLCNLACRYCYYVKKDGLYPAGESFRMDDDILEQYIVQHIEACPDRVIRFSWHGGEPTILGLDYFRRIVALQRRHQPPGQRIANGIQTNGTLINEDWCRFLAAEGFAVGLSLDGPPEMHDRYRLTPDGRPTHEQVMRGYRLLQQHGVQCEVLCVVNACNVRRPIEVYRFLKQIGARYMTFLPLVEREECPKGARVEGVPPSNRGQSLPSTLSGDARDTLVGDLEMQAQSGVNERTVPSDAWGEFLCTVFDEWTARDIGQVKVQIFEEAARPAFGQEHALCVFRKICGGVPVVERNGDFYSCDHFVDAEHRLGNIRSTPLAELLDSPRQRAFGQAKWDTLPRCCRDCEVRPMCNGGCPKDRFLRTPEGEPGLNYLCAGYKYFFTHCEPFVAEVAALWRRTQAPEAPPPVARPAARTGRNDPCPCGSGRKYKNCCMRGY